MDQQYEMQIIVATIAELGFRTVLLVLLLVIEYIWLFGQKDAADETSVAKLTSLKWRSVSLLILSWPLVGILITDYKRFFIAVGEHSMLSFYVGFLNRYAIYYTLWVLLTTLTFVSIRTDKVKRY